MTVERRLIRRNILLGLALTLFTIAVDYLHGMDRLEGWFYNKRVELCHVYTPPPTDHLVHVDIDEAALDTIGKWPWSRATIAEIVDELHRAGASTLALDLFLSDSSGQSNFEQEKSGTTQPASDGGQAAESAANAALAASVKRFGSVIVAVELARGDKPVVPERQRQIVDSLAAATQPTKENLDTALRHLGLPASTSDEYFRGFHETVQLRLHAESPDSEAAINALRETFRSSSNQLGGTIQQRIFDLELRDYQAVHAMQRMLPPLPADGPHLLESIGQKPPLPEITDAASGVGFVNEFLSDDGAVRYIPLFIANRGRLVPQFGLALACAYLGVDLGKIRFDGDRVIIPRPEGQPLVVRTWSNAFQTSAPIDTVIDIPMFGSRSWETMYDYPAHLSKKSHLPIFEVWNVAQTRHRIEKNNGEARRGLMTILERTDPDKYAQLGHHPMPLDDTAAWLNMIRSVLDDPDSPIKLYIDNYTARTPQQQKESKDRASMEETMSICGDLRKAAEQTALLQSELKGLEDSLRSQVQGKAILLGWVADGNDSHQTSRHTSCPGVVVHGAIFNALVTGFLWRRAPVWAAMLATGIVGLLAMAIATWLSPRQAPFAILALLGGYLVLNGEFFFDYHHIVLVTAAPVVALMLNWSGVTGLRLVSEAQERVRLDRKFRSYIDPALVNYLNEHPEIYRIEGAVREMTVIFTDLARFTSFTEHLHERAIKILGKYRSRMVPVIRGHRGLVHHFMGDGLMFSFGAPVENPQHAVDAVRTVLEMHAELERFNIDIEKEMGAELLEELKFKKILPLCMRAGISSGEVVVGDTGGEEASDYICLGDVTNSAARLESCNKILGTHTLLTMRTTELLRGKFLLRPIGVLQVVGKSIGLVAFEPLCEVDRATPEQRQLVAMTREMVDLFRAGSFAASIAAADRLDQTFGPCKLTAIYRDLAARYTAATPPDFDGMIVLSEK